MRWPDKLLLPVQWEEAVLFGELMWYRFWLKASVWCYLEEQSLLNSCRCFDLLLPVAADFLRKEEILHRELKQDLFE